MKLEVKIGTEEVEIHVDDIDGNDIFWDFVDPERSHADLTLEDTISVERQIRDMLPAAGLV